MRISALIFFLACGTQVFSQDPSKTWIGMTGSIDIVKASYFDSPAGFGKSINPLDSNYTNRIRLGGSIGVFVSRSIKDRWAVQIGLHYRTNGDRILSEKSIGGIPGANGFLIIQTAYEFHYHWITVPVKLNYAFVFQKKIQLYVSVSAAPSFLLRESKVSQYYLDNGGHDRNNLANGYSSLEMRPGVTGGFGARIKVSYRWVASIEPQYHGILFWNGLNYSTMLNSYGICLGLWKAI